MDNILRDSSAHLSVRGNGSVLINAVIFGLNVPLHRNTRPRHQTPTMSSLTHTTPNRHRHSPTSMPSSVAQARPRKRGGMSTRASFQTRFFLYGYAYRKQAQKG